MPTCFVIMPLTTPPNAVEQYGGDSDHFEHVLEHLFAPAVKAAGYDLERPKARGADLIHAEIIRKLEEAELVLCDCSQLNANVFFELGIRTALDRPVAMVKDDKTATYPFDTSMINFHSYDSSLAPWRLDKEVKALEQHIRDTAGGADGRNSLWRYFGITQPAKPAEIANPVEAKLDLLAAEVEKLRRGNSSWGQGSSGEALGASSLEPALAEALRIATESGASILGVTMLGRKVDLELDGSISEDQEERILLAGARHGILFNLVRA